MKQPASRGGVRQRDGKWRAGEDGWGAPARKDARVLVTALVAAGVSQRHITNSFYTKPFFKKKLHK